MMLLSGVLLVCGALLSLVWAYEVNRRVPMPRWASVELLWEVLLATAIGVAMVGLLLLLKFVLRFEGLASLEPVPAIAALAALGATALLWLYLLRPLRTLRVIEGGRDTPGAGPAAGPSAGPATGPAAGTAGRARRAAPRKAA